MLFCKFSFEFLFGAFNSMRKITKKMRNETITRWSKHACIISFQSEHFIDTKTKLIGNQINYILTQDLSNNEYSTHTNDSFVNIPKKITLKGFESYLNRGACVAEQF